MGLWVVVDVGKRVPSRQMDVEPVFIVNKTRSQAREEWQYSTMF